MLRLDHVVLPIWEPQKSVAFYRELLGLTLVDALDGDDWGGFPWLMLIFALGDEREVVLVHFAGAERPPPDALPKDGRHLALAETGSLDPWRVKLREAGVAFTEEDHGERTSLYFEDPNGIMLEITAPPAAPGQVENTQALRRAERWIDGLAARGKTR
jgi:catechol 2,3-dioxygenase-like lactoylglutathione lyase family enzyme